MKIKGICLTIVFVLLFGFITTSCNKKIVKVQEEYALEQNKQGYTLPLEKLAVVTLEENGSTGYSWHYYIEDDTILAFSSEETKATTTDKNIVGAPMIHTWKFKAMKPGTTTLKFAYCRPWEAKALESAIEDNPKFPLLKAFLAKWKASIETREYTISCF